METSPKGPKQYSTLSVVCVVVGVVAGLAAVKILAAGITPPQPEGGFNVIELALAGLGGAIGGAIAWLIERALR